jgi:chemotaxis protein CheD
MGGNYARRVLFKPKDGRILVKRLDSASGQNIVREEMEIANKQNVAPPPDDDIELF